MVNTKCLEFTNEGTKVQSEDKNFIVPADTSIFAMGMEPNSEEIEKIKAMAGTIPVFLIGDCRKVGKVGDAIHDGHRAAMMII